MKKYIGCDSHARYSVFVSMDEKGKVSAPVRVEHGNRIHAALRRSGTGFAAALRRYGVMAGEPPVDLVAIKIRLHLSVAIGRLPEETRRATLHEWEMLDLIEKHIGELEMRIRARIGKPGWLRLLKSH